MVAKQVSVMTEYHKGRLVDLTELLSANNIDLLALSLADSKNFNMVRAITNDYEKTLCILKENGYSAKITDVLAVAVPDTPGGLAGVLRLLRDNDIHMKYLYSLVRRVGDKAVLILRVDDQEKAVQLFAQNNITLLDHAALNGN